jgi:hypothetical protein
MTVDEFVKMDATFNQGMFLTKVNNIFVKLLTAIMMDDLDSVRHFIRDDVYEWAESITKEVRDKGQRQMYDELNVKESRIDSIIEESRQYVIKVYLQSRYLNYIINLSDGNLVSGNDYSRIQVNYNLLFTKKKAAQKQGIARKCPGCGAPISVNTSGKCEYCGSTYNQEDYDWVLTKLEVL